MKTKNEFGQIGKLILDNAFEIHKELEPGLLEYVYEFCLTEELINRSLNVQNQIKLPVVPYLKEGIRRKVNNYFLAS